MDDLTKWFGLIPKIFFAFSTFIGVYISLVLYLLNIYRGLL
jgi:hypothetical protein